MFAYCRNNPVKRADICGTADATFYDDDGELYSSKDIENLASCGGAAACAIGAGVSCLFLYGSQKNKPVNLPSHKKMSLNLNHITSGHMPNGNRNPNGQKTIFWGLTTEQMIKAIYEAYQHSTKLQTQGDCIKLMGISETYGLVIEMWVNVITYIIETAYPKG